MPRIRLRETESGPTAYFSEKQKDTKMTPLERVRATIAGEPVDSLAAQPMVMMFAARHAGMRFIDYTLDGLKMAEAQLKVTADFDLDCLLTCSDPAREVIDIAGDGSVDWFDDQGPVINEERAALLDMSRLKSFEVPDPLSRDACTTASRASKRWSAKSGATAPSWAGSRGPWRWPRNSGGSTT